jgi:hypothetical protein
MVGRDGNGMDGIGRDGNGMDGIGGWLNSDIIFNFYISFLYLNNFFFFI